MPDLIEHGLWGKARLSLLCQIVKLDLTQFYRTIGACQSMKHDCLK